MGTRAGVAMAKNKPQTHCERYGHQWSASTSDGFEVCSHVGYNSKGKMVPCQAARRKPGTIPALSPASVPQQSQKTEPVAQQATLWN